MKTSRRTMAVLLLALAGTAAWAQGPNNSGTYYRNADGKSGSQLKTALFDIIKNHKTLGYDDLIEAYRKTDTRADGYVRDWYSNITNFVHEADKAGSYSKEGDVYNREHSIPQSWGAPKSDIMHVFPTDGYVNNRRSNYPFGEVGNVTWHSANSYSKVGTCKTAGYSGTVFEPNDEVKGDIARIYFYMATCYENIIAGWSGGGVITGTKYQPYAQWTYDMLVRWSKLDPVDDVERARNKAVQEVQGNRNPFVDYPGLEDYVWGDKKNQTFRYDNYEGSGTETVTVGQPVFSPNGGTFTGSVQVTITTATAGATIYYTTNGAEASEQSRVYTGAITLQETTTLKAIAVKDGTKSFQTTATFTITDEQGQEAPAEGTIALGNALFGTSFTGVLKETELADFTGTENGITVVYGQGKGSHQYVSKDQIRLYPGNTLTVSVEQGYMTALEFTLATSTTKTLQASTGSVSDYTWTGKAQRVIFSVDSGSGHARLTAVKVELENTTTAIDGVAQHEEPGAVYDTQGRKVADGRQGVENLKPGLYIWQGKKRVVR